MTPVAWIGVAVAGGVGAPCRYLLDAFVRNRTTGTAPWGTGLVNVAGCLVLGLVTGLGMNGHLIGTARVVLASGFCGAFTTFSTFSFETVRLAEEGSLAAAGLNVGLSLLAGLTAAGIGLALGLAL